MHSMWAIVIEKEKNVNYKMEDDGGGGNRLIEIQTTDSAIHECLSSENIHSLGFHPMHVACVHF